MKKRIITCLITVLSIMCCMLVLIGHRLYANEQNLLQAYLQEVIPEIVCIGDSLTAGTGGEGISYPSYLSEKMSEDKLYIPVRNMGVGGESTATIAARMGAIPFRVQAFTIPADTTAVEISFIKEEGRKLEAHADVGISPCVIAGIEGRMTIEDNKCYFTRSNEGKVVEVEEGTTVQTYAQTAFKDGIFIVFMGENGGFRDIDDLVYQQRQILALQGKNSDKYLILGMTSGTAEERQELEERMTAEYGDKYINLREYLSTQGVYDAKISLTEADKEQMAIGKIPDCLLSDGLHFKPVGYQLIANIVYNRMWELGYFDEVKENIENYGGI